MSVFEKIVGILEKELDKKIDGVDENSTFADLGMDSLDVVEVVMAIEDEFDIEISEGDEENIKSLGDAARYVENKING